MSEHSMYRWRRMSEQARADILAQRQSNERPWHSPPHYEIDSRIYLVTAACFEHQPVIGYSPERMADFEQTLLAKCGEACEALYAWTVLPNHYHFLAKASGVRELIRTLGQMHGSTSYQWNSEERCRGRQVWFEAAETGMKSERHFWASFLYVLNNAVKHGYVTQWQDWPYCNAREWLNGVGREAALRLWHEYPIDEFGQDWDPPDL